MNFTTYNITEAEQLGTVADGFVDTGFEETEKGDQKERFKPIPFWTKKGGDDLLAGAGGVISNAKDMVRVLCNVLPKFRLTLRHIITSGNVVASPNFEREVS